MLMEEGYITDLGGLYSIVSRVWSIYGVSVGCRVCIPKQCVPH